MPKISKSIALIAKPSVLSPIIEKCRETTDRELCGILAGTGADIAHAFFVENASKDGSTFEFDAVDFAKTLNKIDDLGLDIVGLFHSHTGGPAVPSSMDVREAKLSAPMLIITPTEVKLYRFREGAPGYEELPFIFKLGNASKSAPGFKFSIEVSEEVMLKLPSMIASYFTSSRAPDFHQRIQDAEQVLRMVRDVTNQEEGLRGRVPDRMLARIDEVEERAVSMANAMANPHVDGVGFAPVSPPVETHNHRYKWMQRTPDGKNIYECTSAGCDKNIIVDGDIEIKTEGKEPEVVVDAVEVKKDEGRNTEGEGSNPTA